MAFELASLGIKLFINRWTESKNKIKSMINEYLKAAAKDDLIKNVDVVLLKDKILQMIKTTEDLNKAIKKSEYNVKNLINSAKEYTQLLKDISDKLPYEHLNNLLELKGTVKEISFGEIEIKSDYEEIALVCIYVADVLLKWIYNIILDLRYIEENYNDCKLGIKFLITAQDTLTRKRSVDESLKRFVNTYLMIYKSTAQYFLCRIKLKKMKGITKELDSIGNGFNYVIRRINSVLEDQEKHKLDDRYLFSAKIILEHSIALLCEITSAKFNVKGLNSFKHLFELSEKSEEGGSWIYNEWEPLRDQLIYDWGLAKFDETDIDYDIAESVNPFYDSVSKFDDEIDEINPFGF